MEADQIQFIKETFNLSTSDLAKSLGVAHITASRWEEESNLPIGLQAEVLQGLYNIALFINGDQYKIELVSGMIKLGIGSMLFYLLNDELKKNQKARTKMSEQLFYIQDQRNYVGNSVS